MKCTESHLKNYKPLTELEPEEDDNDDEEMPPLNQCEGGEELRGHRILVKVSEYEIECIAPSHQEAISSLLYARQLIATKNFPALQFDK